MVGRKMQGETKSIHSSVDVGMSIFLCLHCRKLPMHGKCQNAQRNMRLFYDTKLTSTLPGSGVVPLGDAASGVTEDFHQEFQ
jgi:hypothetical protein